MTETGEIGKSGGVGIKNPGSGMRVLHFSLQDRLFCIELKWVHRILPLVGLRAVPRAPEWMKGLMNLGGESIPVVDLNERLGLAVSPHYSLDTLILLCGNEERKVGLIVQQVLGVKAAEANELKQEQLFQGVDIPFLGVVNREGFQSLLLDLERLFRDDLFSGFSGPVWVAETPAGKG